MVTRVVATQPAVTIYLIVSTPGAIPNTTPVEVPTVATVAIAGVLLFHVPSIITLPRSELAPTHRAVVPVIGPGVVLTVTECVA